MLIRMPNGSRRTRPARLLLVVSAGVSLLGVTGCGSITAASSDSAQVRFVHVSPDTPAVDVYLNGAGAAYNLSFGTVTSYLPLKPGEASIAVRRAGTSQTLVDSRAAMASTRQYTAVVTNTLGSLQETLYPDAGTPAPAGMLAVRVLHEAVGAGPLDVYLLPSGSSALFSNPTIRNLSFGGSDGYVDLPGAKTYTVAVVPAGSAPALAAGAALGGASVSGGSGAVRTVIVTDAPGGRGKGLTGLVLDDLDTQ